MTIANGQGELQGKDLPPRAHRLVRRLRHHDAARRRRDRAGRARRRDRARGRGDALRSRRSSTRRRSRGATAASSSARRSPSRRRSAPLEVRRRRGQRRASSLEIIDRYDAIVVRSATKLTAELIGRAARLKVIGRAGVGVDNVDVEAATRRGIVVANAPESTVVSAAEHTIGLLVALARNIPQAHAALKQGRWERKQYGGIELAGKTLGVLGFGRIGQQVARRALGLGMRVVAYDPFVVRRALPRARRRARRSASTNVYARGGVPHAALAADARDSRLDRRGRVRARCGTACGSSTPRGASSSTRTHCSRRSTPARSPGAALDVFSEEPYAGPLLELDNVVVTPHLAASTDEAQDRAGVIVAEQVLAALDGGLVTNAVNIPVIGAEDLEALGPYIPLAAKLGRLAMELDGRARPTRSCSRRTAASPDYDTRLLTVSALNGAFQGRADRPVNYVNAPLIARERGIEVREERSQSARDYTNLLRVEIRVGDEKTRVAGTTDRQRQPAVARERTRLRARDRARAAARPLPLRRRARRDRPRRHAVRRGRRQHRQHDRVAVTPWRQGADGALGGLDAAARPRGAHPGRRLRRRARHRARPGQCSSPSQAVPCAG